MYVPKYTIHNIRTHRELRTFSGTWADCKWQMVKGEYAKRVDKPKYDTPYKKEYGKKSKGRKAKLAKKRAESEGWKIKEKDEKLENIMARLEERISALEGEVAALRMAIDEGKNGENGEKNKEIPF